MCSKIFFLFLILIAKADLFRILAVFPVPSISHQVVFRVLTKELANRGHEVVIVTPDPAYTKGNVPDNIKEIDVQKESYRIWEEKFVKSGVLSAYEGMKLAFTIIVDIFEAQWKTEELQTIIKRNETFDLLLVEACVRPALILSHIFKVPVIQVSSFGSMVINFLVHGALFHPILYPENLSTKVYNLTVWEKINVIYSDIKLKYLLYSLESVENDMIRRNLGPTAPTVSELNSNVDMLFLNTHEIWDGIRPVPPGIIYMGGLHTAQWNRLPKDLELYLNSSIDGVIYMSFGTNIQPSLIPSETIQTFLKVFEKLPYDILIKWDKDHLENKPKNVRIFKWVPQTQVLKHTKIKLFITQGGLQSTDEAIDAGIPLIAFPMVADQWFNAEKYVYHGIGLKLNIETVTENILEEAINTVIEDERYRLNIIKLRTLMNDRPERPLERAMWWIEYVIRHRGAKHLRAPGANISWSEYFMLDVLLTLFVGLIISIIIILGIVIFLINKIFSQKPKIKTN